MAKRKMLVGMSSVNFNFQGKTAVITGAGRGLGRMTARMFLEAGAKVVYLDCVSYSDLQSEIKKYGGRAIFLKVNVAEQTQVKKAFRLIVEKFKTIDILVNNAGIARGGSVEETTSAIWDEVMATNVRSQFLCIQAGLPFMKKKRYGKIVNVSSIAGRDKSILLGASYTASKAAIIGLTRHVAAEVAGCGINVNCICPSQHRTPMLESVLTKKMEQMLLKRIPLGYIAQPEQIAGVILFLSSDMANYMSGAIVDVNGGLL